MRIDLIILKLGIKMRIILRIGMTRLILILRIKTARLLLCRHPYVKALDYKALDYNVLLQEFSRNQLLHRYPNQRLSNRLAQNLSQRPLLKSEFSVAPGQAQGVSGDAPTGSKREGAWQGAPSTSGRMIKLEQQSVRR
jgi:hypothetical protein